MGRATRQDVHSLIRDLNAAAIGDLPWASALAGLTRVVPGAFATFEVLDTSTGRYVDFHSSAELDIDQPYLDHYFEVSPRLDGLLGPVRKEVMGDYDFLSEREMDRNEFYADFLAPHGLRYCAGIRVLETPGCAGFFSIQRAPNHGHVDTAEIQLLRRLRPHMRQVVRAYRHVGALKRESAERETALAHLQDGVLLLAPGGTVLYVNPAAATICQANDGLAVRRGVLEIRCRRARATVERALAAAGAPTSLDRVHSAQVVVSRRADGPPYLLTISPARSGDDTVGAASDAAVIVFIRDPLRSGRLAPEVLEEAYRLTAAEAALATALFDGMTVRQFAQDRGVTLATARTQLASVMQKMGVHRQTDLIRLLSGLVSAIR